jgi:hypothetical protein
MSKNNIDPLEILNATDAALIRSALRNKARRRDVMGWLMAGGIGIATAGSIVTHATRALAQTPKKGGRLRVAGSSTSTADTVDPAKQSFSTDYSTPSPCRSRSTRPARAAAPASRRAMSTHCRTCCSGHPRHELAATIAQNCGRNVLHSKRVQQMTDPIVGATESSINARRGATQNRLDEVCERDEAGSVDDDRLDARRRPSIRTCPIGPFAVHGEGAEIGMA